MAAFLVSVLPVQALDTSGDALTLPFRKAYLVGVLPEREAALLLAHFLP